jgi:hypothetical protein
MSHATVLLDANVLYPAPLRDLLIQLATTGLYQAKWSADIHREWIEALLRNEPWRDPVALDRTRALMDRAVRDCLVSGYRSLIGTLSLPDADDRHVLAAAIAGGCEVIVTKNRAHFPASALTPFGIEAQHPDEFLAAHLTLMPRVFCGAVRTLRARLLNPPIGVDEYLTTLNQQGLTATVAGLGQYADSL